jgi:hypothetical protein
MACSEAASQVGVHIDAYFLLLLLLLLQTRMMPLSLLS